MVLRNSSTIPNYNLSDFLEEPIGASHRTLLSHPNDEGFPGGARGKELTGQCRRHKRLGFNPWVGKIPWRRAWQPTPVFLPGESHGQRGLAGYSPRGHKESDTTEMTQHACTQCSFIIRQIQRSCTHLRVWFKEKGAAEDEMVRWHHRLNGHGFEQTPGDSGGRRSLVCCSLWGRR